MRFKIKTMLSLAVAVLIAGFGFRARAQENPKLRVVAKVWEKEITGADLLAETDRLIKLRIQRGEFTAKNVPPEIMDELQKVALMNLMRIEVMRHVLDANNIVVSPKEFNKFIKKQNENYTRYFHRSLRDVVEESEDYSKWEDRRMQELRLQKYSFQRFQKDPDGWTKRYYEENRDSLPVRRFRHIVMTFGDGKNNSRTEAEARAALEKIRKRILAGEISFSTAAMTISEDPFSSIGGMMHFVSKDGGKVYDPGQGYLKMKIPDGIVEHIYSLKKVGDVSKVFRVEIDEMTPDGHPSGKRSKENALHMVQLTDIRPWQAFRANYSETDKWMRDNFVADEVGKAKKAGKYRIFGN